MALEGDPVESEQSPADPIQSCLWALVAILVFAGFGESVAQEAAWTPPAPNEKGFDWIQLVSGEWLGGQIKSMRDGSLEFDSDQLDVLKLAFPATPTATAWDFLR